MRTWSLSALLLGILGVMVVASLFTSLSSPTGPQRVGDIAVQMATRPDPLVVGPAELDLTVTGAQGESLEDAAVEVRYGMERAGVTMLQGVAATREGAGRYRIVLLLREPGPWQLSVIVRRPGQPDREITYTVNVLRRLTREGRGVLGSGAEEKWRGEPHIYGSSSTPSGV